MSDTRRERPIRQHSEPTATEPARKGPGAPEALRDRLLAASWQHLTLLERLGAGPAGRLLAEEIAAERASATALPALRRWTGLPPGNYTGYTEGASPVRMSRVLDFVLPGDRVLDIGIGYGYQTSVLVRTGLLEHYAGIDTSERLVASARDGLEHNRLPTDRVHLEVRGADGLDRAWVKQHKPTLVLLLDQLERDDDVEGTLERLAGAIDRGTSVLFTVPMEGRLEGVLGHRSTFDQHRIRALCEAAGLTIHYVEPLHNTWVLVLASTSPKVPERLLAAARIPHQPLPPGTERDYYYRDVDLKSSDIDYRRSGKPKRGRARVHRTRGGLRCEITPTPNQSPPYYGGVALPVASPGLLRLQVVYENPEHIVAVYVDGYDGDERVARWKWTVGDAAPTAGAKTLHLIKPGGGGRFKPLGGMDPDRIERIEFYVEMADGAPQAAFAIRKASYAPFSSL